MTTRVSRRWRPRSLLQLVLLAFLVVMLPLAVLMLQAGPALSELSRLADVSARQAVEETRRARSLSALALEMERGARQYAVVEQESLLEIYAERIEEYREMLAQQRQLLPDDPDVAALEAQLVELARLPELPLEEFEERLIDFIPFAQHTEAVRRATNRQIDIRIDAIRERAEAVQTQLWLQTAALVSASLVLMLLFTWLIIRPVRQLERRVLSIGSGGQSHAVRPIQGPAELVQLDERLDWLSSRLEELEAEKQQFLRHMSHELKTPLASVREGSALLADGVAGELSPHQREILELIDASGGELQRLIEQLLDYNLLQHNRQMQTERLDVATVAKEVLAKHRLALDNKGMRVDCFDGPLEWQADRAATTSILDNLISNAIAYGEDAGELVVRARRCHDRLTIEVANSGAPIADEDRPRLFEAFYQGRARRKGPLKGSGIGLSVAADCARLQHGSLELVDDPYYAVCFRLTLPRVLVAGQLAHDHLALVGETSTHARNR
ncbi:sensor histidine kinase [Halomonas heilongjiangensis]|uniref:histidine kinase n=1 Tax=Halomonas heilongjiangensis TaxID=1387883 RepID=A0A2N7TS48_9GAMM|nr:HAMP domain-containing sensor histidine kinase [Halomonas heilongjiangensis]PMR70996.1 two-component sensor histidine kinase [Halomonas heilongjiangensis]PXX91357.1 two-component sensor histidine kinase [Halomonas heilongjiangensis]